MTILVLLWHQLVSPEVLRYVVNKKEKENENKKKMKKK